LETGWLCPDLESGVEPDAQRLRIRCTSPSLTDSSRVERLVQIVAGGLRADPDTLELDLSTVRRADTKLVASLIWLVRISRRRGVRFVVRVSPPVEGVIVFCRVRSLVELACDRQPADSHGTG
jgi:ABC-type transporter Mla MlaB component